MTPFFAGIFLLGLSSLVSAANFTQVFEWPDKLDLEWPLNMQDGAFKAENISPRYMAVYGERIFLSLYKSEAIAATLVSLAKSSASSEPPQLTPFPSWETHLDGSFKMGNSIKSRNKCDKMDMANGLQVDSVGRLWVLDSGSTCNKCNAKLWIFNLNNNKAELIHQFSFHGWMHDLVIDETADGTFAYISRWAKEHIVVFCLESNTSWMVDTPGIKVISVALSSEQLYLGNYLSFDMHFISVSALRNGTGKANLIGHWNTFTPYRMLVDNRGTLYAAFFWENYLQSWSTAQPFKKQRVYHQVAGVQSFWPFSLAMDQNDTPWVMAYNEEREPRYRLFKAALGAKSFKNSPECSGTLCHEIDTAY
ncbi:uncharacterized protein LOC135936864 [Cloeon dipterum]|uniref:uncharacterized protein LOC135936864 n=1 Tax=Cloeon dipterum TaxID=197152 RepID=UPI0032200D93